MSHLADVNVPFADWSDDEVHEAALDSFPASDPPSWSPLRIGAPASPEPGGPSRP